jgi:hypothetical protein
VVDIFPLPRVDDLDTENVLDLVELGTSALQTYVWYEGITNGDVIYPNWRGCSESGDVVDFINSPIDVVGDVSSGMPVDVPNASVIPLDQGQAFYSYAVKRLDETDIGVESKRLIIYIGKRPAQKLPPAQITESNALCIDVDDIPGGGASVTVLPYQAMAAGDKVTYLWSGYMDETSPPEDPVTYEYLVQIEDIGQPLTWFIEKSHFYFIEGGYGYLDYSVEYTVPTEGRISHASQQRFEIISSREPLLAAPTINGFTGVELNPDAYPDGITVTIPLIENARVGDDLRVYGKSSVQALSAIRTLHIRTLRIDPSNLDSGRLECIFESEWLVENNWQSIELFYQWGRERFSRSSNVLSFEIKQLRDLIEPMVKNSYPDLNGQFKFDAIEGSVTGIDVIIPDAAIIDASDTVNVEWAFANGISAYTGSSYSDRPREFNVPLQFIAPYMGKRIDVAYSVTPENPVGEGEIYYSKLFNVEIDRLPANQFPLLKHGLNGSANTLSLAEVPDAGALFLLMKWKFMAVGQRITIEAKGGTSNPTLKEYLCEGAEVSEADVLAGQFNAILTKSFVRQITENSKFTLSTKVSFDGGETYLSFRLLELTRVA